LNKTVQLLPRLLSQVRHLQTFPAADIGHRYRVTATTPYHKSSPSYQWLQMQKSQHCIYYLLQRVSSHRPGLGKEGIPYPLLTRE